MKIMFWLFGFGVGLIVGALAVLSVAVYSMRKDQWHTRAVNAENRNLELIHALRTIANNPKDSDDRRIAREVLRYDNDPPEKPNGR